MKGGKLKWLLAVILLVATGCGYTVIDWARATSEQRVCYMDCRKTDSLCRGFARNTVLGCMSEKECADICGLRTIYVPPGEPEPAKRCGYDRGGCKRGALSNDATLEE